MSRQSSVALMLGSLLAICAGCNYPGQRLLQARVEKDGQVVLQTHFGVPDSWDGHTAWRRLEGRALEVVDPKVLEADDSGQIALKGKIRVALVHVDKTFAAAEVSQLRLTAGGAGADTWQLAPGEVERTSKVLGTKGN